ncbi:MAG: tRNA pseudouridine(55) synthase TruB [Pirellulaceae bacterium]|nr:tRNA pseudouridine(55) synthase TruB [Pirellulaceae bacterium]
MARESLNRHFDPPHPLTKYTVFGLLNVNKPKGLTSRDVVNHVQRIVKPLKVGHAGTLDPLANGVLMVTIGPATRLTEFIQRMPKAYRGTFLLGRTSDTEDILGTVNELDGVSIPSPTELAAAIPQFVGQILQRPPAYSALKVKGKRAYQRAREGEQFTLNARPIRIDHLEIESYCYPELTLVIGCGSGTYVRSLGRDLAAAVATGAVMSALTRTAIGHFELSKAIPLEQITRESLPDQLIPPVEAVSELPQILINPADQILLQTGRAVSYQGFESPQLAAVNETGELLAILQRRDGNHQTSPQFIPVRNFSARPNKR